MPVHPTARDVCLLICTCTQHVSGDSGEAGNQAAMIMAECPKGMARQIRNTMFTLVAR